jgi:WD40-like Beta Propeller Repeat
MLALLGLAGCGLLPGNAQEAYTIPPVSAAAPSTDLGPGVRPLSFGPGDKSSPRMSPSGESVAFVLDGYVVEKPTYAQNFRRKTSYDFGAEQTEWLPDEGLGILSPEGDTDNQDTEPTPSSFFGVQPDSYPTDGSSDVRRLVERVVAAGALPGRGVIAAVAMPGTVGSPEEPPKNRLVLLRGSEKPMKVYLRSIKGFVTGLSVSSDGREAILAIRHSAGEADGRFEIQSYQLSVGRTKRVARLPKGMEILGAPQWTPEGVHFVAGDADDPAPPDKNLAPYSLYRVPEGSDTPEPVRVVGEGFAAASISASPDGRRLAVVGRRNPGSPTNLYVLDLASNTLEAATANENMEIKTNPRDLVWSPDSRSVILIARGVLSGPEVYDAPVSTLSSAFYNLYEVPVPEPPTGGGSKG